jgi:hypothetical protein
MPRAVPLFLRQRSLQNFTSSHTFSHFLRHANGRPQTMQGFDGRSCFFTPLMAAAVPRFPVDHSGSCREAFSDIRCLAQILQDVPGFPASP